MCEGLGFLVIYKGNGEYDLLTTMPDLTTGRWDVSHSEIFKAHGLDESKLDRNMYNTMVGRIELPTWEFNSFRWDCETPSWLTEELNIKIREDVRDLLFKLPLDIKNIETNDQKRNLGLTYHLIRKFMIVPNEMLHEFVSADVMDCTYYHYYEGIVMSIAHSYVNTFLPLVRAYKVLYRDMSKLPGFAIHGSLFSKIREMYIEFLNCSVYAGKYRSISLSHSLANIYNTALKTVVG